MGLLGSTNDLGLRKSASGPIFEKAMTAYDVTTLPEELEVLHDCLVSYVYGIIGRRTYASRACTLRTAQTAR